MPSSTREGALATSSRQDTRVPTTREYPSLRWFTILLDDLCDTSCGRTAQLCGAELVHTTPVTAESVVVSESRFTAVYAEGLRSNLDGQFHGSFFCANATQILLNLITEN